MPRKSQNPKSDRQRIQFAFNADLDSAVGATFQYLLKNPHFPSRAGKHKGTDAMMAFWQPFAYQEAGELSEEELKAIARESVEALSRQMDLIGETFGLEPSQEKVSAPDLKAEIQQAVNEAVQKLITTGALTSSAQTVLSTEASQSKSFVESEGVDFDEDALFGNLLEDAAIAA